MSFVNYILGPRIPTEELARHRLRYAAPMVSLSIARVLLLCSVFLPYWQMKLEAPQYPKGLYLTAYVNRIEGHVREINALNHYIGMRKLDEAAPFEKAVSVWAIVSMVLLVEGAMFIHSKWAAALVLPAILFPAMFILDLHLWMKDFGLNLDPKAPLSSSVKPFVPTVLGVGEIGQFKTIAWMGWGLILAIAGSVMSIAALFFHRFAFRPLYLRMLAARREAKDTPVCV